MEGGVNFNPQPDRASNWGPQHLGHQDLYHCANPSQLNTYQTVFKYEEYTHEHISKTQLLYEMLQNKCIYFGRFDVAKDGGQEHVNSWGRNWLWRVCKVQTSMFPSPLLPLLCRHLEPGASLTPKQQERRIQTTAVISFICCSAIKNLTAPADPTVQMWRIQSTEHRKY